MSTEHREVPSYDPDAAFKTSKLKALCKLHTGRIWADGKGNIITGHWVVRISEELRGHLPEAIEMKEGLFYLKVPCLWISGSIERGEDVKPPDVEAVWPSGKGNFASLATEKGRPKILIGGGTGKNKVHDVCEIKNSKISVYLNESYYSKIIALNGHVLHDLNPCEITDEISPVVIHVCEGIDAIIMPTKL